MIQNVKAVSVPVGDHDEAVRFYCDVLGLAKVVDAPMGDAHRYVEVALPGGDAVLAPYTWYEREEVRAELGGYSRVVLGCDDVQRTYDELVAKGAQFEGEPFGEHGRVFAALKDPWGNVFVLAPADPVAE